MSNDLFKKILKLIEFSEIVKEGNNYFVDIDLLTNKEIKEIKKITGKDLTGYKRTLDISGIKHSIKKHPNLSYSDFLLIPIIVKNYDFIGKGKKDDIIVYKKEIGNEYFYIEQIRKGRKKLVIKTFYKRKKRKK